MTTQVTLLPEDYIHVLILSGDERRPLIIQGKGRYDFGTNVLFIEYRELLLPIPLLGEIDVKDLRA